MDTLLQIQKDGVYRRFAMTGAFFSQTGAFFFDKPLGGIVGIDDDILTRSGCQFGQPLVHVRRG